MRDTTRVCETPTISFSTAALPNWTPWSSFCSGAVDRAFVAPALCALIEAERSVEATDGMGRAVARAHPIEDQVAALARRLEAVEERIRCVDERFVALAAAGVCSRCGCSLDDDVVDGAAAEGSDGNSIRRGTVLASDSARAAAVDGATDEPPPIVNDAASAGPP